MSAIGHGQMQWLYTIITFNSCKFIFNLYFRKKGKLEMAITLLLTFLISRSTKIVYERVVHKRGILLNKKLEISACSIKKTA